MEFQNEQTNCDPQSPQPGTSQRLFSEEAYGPENLKLICEAFDGAWEAVARIVDSTPLAREAARLKLANLILSIASNDKLDQARAKPAP